jgi:beta-glucosidase-like glycosyl hydrolase
VADINNNPANPIINTRSFGEDSRRRRPVRERRGSRLQQNGMLATAKHFRTWRHRYRFAIALPVIKRPGPGSTSNWYPSGPRSMPGPS